MQTIIINPGNGAPDPALAGRVTAVENRTSAIEQMPILGVVADFDFSAVQDDTFGSIRITTADKSVDLRIFGWMTAEDLAMQFADEWQYFLDGEALSDGSIATIRAPYPFTLEYIDVPVLGPPAGELVPDTIISDRSIDERFEAVEAKAAAVSVPLNEAAYDPAQQAWRATLVGLSTTLDSGQPLAVAGGSDTAFAAGEPAITLALFRRGEPSIIEHTWVPEAGDTIDAFETWLIDYFDYTTQLNRGRDVIVIASRDPDAEFFYVSSSQPQIMQRRFGFVSDTQSELLPRFLLRADSISATPALAGEASLSDVINAMIARINELEQRLNSL